MTTCSVFHFEGVEGVGASLDLQELSIPGTEGPAQNSFFPLEGGSFLMLHHHA